MTMPYLADVDMSSERETVYRYGDRVVHLTVKMSVVVPKGEGAQWLYDHKRVVPAVESHMREALAELGVDDSRLPSSADDMVPETLKEAATLEGWRYVFRTRQSRKPDSEGVPEY